jgi:hypothetical protein
VSINQGTCQEKTMVCFPLMFYWTPQDLANPRISNHLDYFPELPNGGQVHKLAQSQKWLKCLSLAHHPQMCEVNKKHFFIFEPVQLRSKAVVIPIFLFMYNSQLTSRVIEIDQSNMCKDGKGGVKIAIPKDIDFNNPILTSVDVANFHRDYSKISLANGRQLIDACNHQLIEANQCADGNQVQCVPNPWRLKANGKVIRHVPITLYTNDTSGNVSKQFNKNISFFFTLSGLPPDLSNQEYNCHFLSTSNVVSVLELSEQIVDEWSISRYC